MNTIEKIIYIWVVWSFLTLWIFNMFSAWVFVLLIINIFTEVDWIWIENPENIVFIIIWTYFNICAIIHLILDYKKDKNV